MPSLRYSRGTFLESFFFFIPFQVGLLVNTQTFTPATTSKMRVPIPISIVTLLIAFANAQATPDLCPSTTELACHDVINSSLCLSQQASRNGTPEAMAACVEYSNGMSDLPGATKVSLFRCSQSLSKKCWKDHHISVVAALH
jgi:hypothetical protein